MCVRSPFRMALLALLAIGLAPQPAGAAAKKKLPLALCAPDRHDFTLAVDNPFFPLPVGQQWIYVGEEDGETVGLRITVLDDTELLYAGTAHPVVTRVVEEVEWLDEDADGVIDPDEDLIELSLNFFAQTEEGTVCYFGEEVTEFDDEGEPIPGAGAWRADEPGHAPGIFMPADPQPGMKFATEAAPGIAEDEFKVIGSGPVEVPAGRFEEVIRVREFNPLDEEKGYKRFAEGVGLVVDGPLLLVSF